ncbi:MAG: YidB family protein [Bauldia sp.]
MASGRMIALLGLLAVAGYQNRDKIGQLLGRLTGNNAGAANDPTPPDAAGAAAGTGGSFFDNLGNIFGGNARNAPEGQSGGGIGDFLGNLFGGGSSPREAIGGGLNDLVDRFKGNGHEAEAKSWIEVGPNQTITEPALEEALGEDTIDELTRQTGLSRTELIARLKTVLPTAVDALTPDGRLPPATGAAAA